MNATKRKYFFDYLSALLGAGASRGFQFLSTILIARYLGKENYGQFSLFYAAFTLVPLFPSAFDTNYIKHAKNLSQGESKQEYLRINIAIKLLILIAIIALGIPALSLWLNRNSLTSLSAPVLYILGSMGGGCLCLNTTLASQQQEEGNFLASALTETSYCFFSFIGLFILISVWKITDIWQVILLYLIVALGTGLYSIAVLKRIVGSIHKICLTNVIVFLYSSKWIFITGLIIFLFPRLDIFILSKYVSYGDIGIYSASNSLITMLALFSRSLNKISLPKAMNEAITSIENYNKFKKEVYNTSLLLFIIAMTIFFASEKFIRFLYGVKYSESYIIFRILSIGYLSSMIFAPHSYIFYAINLGKLLFIIELVKSAIAILLLIVLVPLFGLKGAASAISISLLTMTIISYILLKKFLKKHFFQKKIGATND